VLEAMSPPELSHPDKLAGARKQSLHTMPSHDATVSSVLVKTPAPEVQSAIENELETKGYQLESVAYTMEVQKSNLEDKTASDRQSSR
jgi:hypothetical protein